MNLHANEAPIRQPSYLGARPPKRPFSNRVENPETDRPSLRSLDIHLNLVGRALLLLLIFGLSGCATTSGSLRKSDLFVQHHIITGSSEHQTVLTGFLLDGVRADIAVVKSDGREDHQLQLYSFAKGTWAPSLDARLRSGVLFVDVAHIGGHDRLISYERGRLNWFDPASGTERILVKVATSYNGTRHGLSYAGVEPLTPASEGEIPRIDITRDLNHDGLDDLIIPDVDGFWVIIQLERGTFADPVKLGPNEPFRNDFAFGEERRYGSIGISPLTIPWYLSRVHTMDYNRDGRTDLVFWNEDHFEIHLQNTQGLFSVTPEILSVDVPIDSDGAYSVMFSFKEKTSFGLIFGVGKKTERTVLRSIRDLNGDGLADLLIHNLEGRGLKQSSRYDIHFGTLTSKGINFAKEVGTAIQPQGKFGAGEYSGYSSLWIEDLNGDDQVDILRCDVRMGLGAMVRALLRTSFSIDAEFFPMNHGVYSKKARRTIKANFDLPGKRTAGFFPAVLVGDVNGDGRSDLLVGKSREELHVFMGEASPGFFEQDPHKVLATLPSSERNSHLVDLNRDGKQDVLMRQPSLSGPHRLTILMAR